MERKLEIRHPPLGSVWWFPDLFSNYYRSMVVHNISTFEFSNLNDSFCLGLTGFLDEPPVDPPIDFNGPGANQQDPNQKNPRNPPGDSLISFPTKHFLYFLFVTLQHNDVLFLQRYCLHFYTFQFRYIPGLLAPSFRVTIFRFELNTGTLHTKTQRDE